MNSKTLFFLVIGLILIYSCNTTSHTFTNNPRSSFNGTDRPPNAKPGACYAKCLMPGQIAVNNSIYAIYTGDETIENVEIETMDFVLKPASSKWEKKRSEKNCNSPDPNDCLVWCLVQIPAETISYKILKDTTQSENYELKEINQQELTKKGGYTEWKEVLCENQITNVLISQIASILLQNGFYAGGIVSELNPQLKSSLSAFQKSNQLPVGQLDFETLDALGIAY